MADQTITSAINDVTEENLGLDESAEETTEETTDDEWGTAPKADEEEEESEDGEGESDEEDEEAESEASGPESDEQALLERITPEQLAKIKANPELAAIYKGMVGAVTKKFQQAGEALRLVEAYNQDPNRFISALAQANGYQVFRPGQQQQQPPQQAAAQAMDDAGKELEALFGEKVGPKVRDVFEKWFQARAGNVVAPIRDTLGRVVATGEAARMTAEEQAFMARHSKTVDKEMYDEIVKLGESGKVVPGDKMTPAEYLDTLYEIVRSRRARRETREVRGDASKKLAKRIERNRRDREPSGVSARSAVRPVSAVKPGMSISEALDAAARELESER